MNAFKRKMSLANEEAAKQKLAKLDESTKSTTIDVEMKSPTDENQETPINEEIKTMETSEPIEVVRSPSNPLPNQTVVNVMAEENVNSPLRRGSQESTATTTTQTTTTTTGTDSTSSSSSDSSSSDTSSSDSDDSSSEDDETKVSSDNEVTTKVKRATF